MKYCKILGLIVFFFLLSCGKEFRYEPEPVDAVELDMALLRFTAASGSASVQVSAKESWDAIVPEAVNWVTADREGSMLRVSVTSNEDIFERSAVLKVKAGNRLVDVKVIQDPLGLNAALSDTLFAEVDCNGTSITFNLTSNVSWQIISDDWITTETPEGEGSQTLTMRIGRNFSLASREGYIDFYHFNVLIGRVEVLQKPVIPILSIDRDTTAGITVPYTAFEETVTVNSNWPWSVYASEGADWMSIEAPAAGADGLIPEGSAQIVKLKAAQTKPARSATVYFASASQLIRLPIVQQEIPTELSVLPQTIEVPYTGGNYQVEVNCNNIWYLSTLPDWIAADKTTGSEDRMTVTFTISKTLSSARNADIVFTSSDKTAVVSISQSAAPETVKTLVFNGTDGYKALIPNLYTSSSSCYDLGVVERKAAVDTNYVLEFYSRGLTLWFNATTGLRINPNPGTHSVTNQLREENFAYIKFPVIEGLAATKVIVNSANAVTDIYLTTAIGPTNDNAIATSVSNQTSVAAGDNTFATGTPKAIPYYLFMAKASEYRFKTIEIHYIPVE